MTILTYGIIRDLEGGYFHPYMLVDGRIPSKGSSLYRTSGETYGGLDRHAGHDLFYRSQIPHGLRSSPIDAALYVQQKSDFRSSDDAHFWRLLDSFTHRYKLPWNFRFPNPFQSQMAILISRIMTRQFHKNLIAFCSPRLASIIMSNPFLLAHFFYATWNGPGWFKRFAKSLDSLISTGRVDQNDLVRRAYMDRHNSSFVQIRKAAPVLWRLQQLL